MALKELYSEEQWKTLQLSFAWVFDFISGTDKKIDKKETEAMIKIINSGKTFKSQLANEVLSSVSDFDNLQSLKISDVRKHKVGLKEAGALIESKLDRKDAVEFKKALVACGYFLADSSGSLFNHNVSHDEMDALNEIGFTLNISVKDLLQVDSIKSIIDRFE
jgi:hypothetical protein